MNSMPKSRWLLVTTAIVLSLSTPVGAAAESVDQCRTILDASLFNTMTRTSSQANTQAERSAFCRMTLDQARSAVSKASGSSSNTGGGFSYGVFGGDLNLSSSSLSSMSQEEWHNFKSQNCGSHDEQSNASSSDYYAQSAVGEGVVQAWKDCVIKVRGLTCTASPHGNAIQLSVNWNFDSNILPVVSRSSLSTGIPASSNPFQPNATIMHGKTEFVLDRDRTKDFAFTLNAEREGKYNESCSAFVGAEQITKPAVTVQSDISALTGRWCITGASFIHPDLDMVGVVTIYQVAPRKITLSGRGYFPLDDGTIIIGNDGVNRTGPANMVLGPGDLAPIIIPKLPGSPKTVEIYGPNRNQKMSTSFQIPKSSMDVFPMGNGRFEVRVSDKAMGYMSLISNSELLLETDKPIRATRCGP